MSNPLQQTSGALKSDRLEFSCSGCGERIDKAVAACFYCDRRSSHSPKSANASKLNSASPNSSNWARLSASICDFASIGTSPTFRANAKFEPGVPENSFLLSANGEIRIDQIQALQNYMQGVHLVVLSACETAVGGPDESGIEIPGISYYFLRNQAKAVLASLWLVNDASTSLLMQQFYGHLANGNPPITKAEALRQAQRAMITGEFTAVGGDRSVTIGVTDTRTGLPPVAGDWRHPYYWAPFILIGNGL